MMANPDLARIKRNVAKMAGMNAPEADIDGYIASEGTTIDAVRDFRPSQVKFGGAAMNATAGVNETIYTLAGAPVDLVRGGMNLASRGINAVAGTDIPQIPDDSFGGSKSIARAAGALAPQLDPENTVAETRQDRVARGVGQGVAGTVLPAGLAGAAMRAGALAPRAAPLVEALAGRSNSVRAVGADAVAGAAAGGGAARAQEGVSEEYKPLASLAGGIVGGGLGAVATGIPALTRAVAEAGGNFLAPLSTQGRERLAGQTLVDAAQDPRAAVKAMEEASKPEVVGSLPTTFQQTGDMGLGSLERQSQTKFPAEFQQRRAEQNNARREALDTIQPDGAPETVSRALRDRLKTIDDETAKGMSEALEWERSASRNIGQGQPPEQAGDAMREALQKRRDKAMEKEGRLWSAVDPDGTLQLPPQDARRTAQEIIAELPKSAKPPSAEEAAIYGVLGQYGDVMPFREVSALRSRVSQAAADERGRYGKSPSWARLVQLRGAIESDLENAVSRKVLVEEQAVAAGQMREEDTLSAIILRDVEAWRSERAAAASGDGGTSSLGGRGPGRATGAAGVSGAAGEGPYGSRQPSSDPRLPQDAGGAGGQADRLTLDEIRSLNPKDDYFVRSRDNQTFVPKQRGNPDLGSAPTPSGQDAPIRIRRNELRHISDPKHYADAEVLGYNDPWEMVNDVAGSWTEMRRAEGNRILLVKPAPDASGVAVVELKPVDGENYWRVVTSGRRSEKQMGERLAVRERTPEASTGFEGPLTRDPPLTGSEPRYTTAASSPEYTPAALPQQEFRAFDDAAKARLDTATEATRDRAATFDNRQLGPMLARPADHSPYNMESAKVAARVFTPGAGGFERIQTFRNAAGTKQGMGAVEAYAIDSLRKAAIDRDTGAINPAKLESWRKAHTEALRAFPELEIRIRNAADAAQAVETQAVARKVAVDDAQKGAVGKLIGTEDPQDVVKVVGGLFSRQDSARQLGQLRQRIGDDKEALQGLRKAVADHVTLRMVGNTEAATSGRELMKSDHFQTFMKANRNALRTVFDEREVRLMEAVAADLQQANRSLASVKIPGQSNTAQDSQSILTRLMNAGMENWLTVAGGTAGATVAGPGGALAGGGLAAVFNGLRQNGIAKVDDLVRDALLNPERARFLMTKIPAEPRQAEAMLKALARRYVKAAGAGAAVDVAPEQPKGPMTLPPWVQPREAGTDLQRALMNR